MGSREYQLLLGICIIVVILGLSYFYYSNLIGDNEELVWTNTIKITENGFQPESAAILLGEEVTFVNNLNKDTWPASNFHPTHDLYKEFDPMKSLRPGESWTFRFDKEGIWYFHDHLDPFIRGKIAVYKNKEDALNDTGVKDCTGLKSPELDYCVSISIEEVIEEKGIEGGLDLFLKTHKDMAECHQIAHRIGEMSYESYIRGSEVYFGPETALCGWGFWHGFSTRFAQTAGKDYDAAKEFCLGIDQHKIAAVDSCFHGIGIGLVPDPPDPKIWGNPIAVVNKAAGNCDFAGSNHKDYMDCLGGAYHGVIDYMREGLYNLQFDKEKPFLICQSQEGKNKKDACYSQMMLLGSLFYDDEIEKFLDKFLKAETDWNTLETGGAEAYILLIVNNYPDYLEKRGGYSGDALVQKCRLFPGEYQTFCIEGMTRGHFQTGNINEKEYESASNFCSHSELNVEEKEACTSRVLKSIYEFYPDSEARKICKEIELNENCL